MAALQQPKKVVGGAFGRFLAARRGDFVKLCAGQPITAVSKLAGEHWQKLSENDRGPYQKEYEAAKKKYAVDLKTFIQAGGEQSKGAAAVRREKKKAREGTAKPMIDPNRPKKACGGAFGCFLDQNRKAFMKDCPGGVAQVSKLASARWKVLPTADRAGYEKAYQAKKAVYDEAIRKYVPPRGASAQEAAPAEPAACAEPEPPAKKGKRGAAAGRAEPEAPAKKAKRGAATGPAEPEPPAKTSKRGVTAAPVKPEAPAKKASPVARKPAASASKAAAAPGKKAKN